jgi:transcriptional regulator with XRE-family HTH domain
MPGSLAIVSGMATVKIRKGARLHYYITEWMRHLGLSDQDVANRMDLSSRTSVWKLRTQQHRLTPEKVAHLAHALGRHPSELLFPPEVPSLDALAEGATPEQRAAIVSDIIQRMRRKG